MLVFLLQMKKIIRCWLFVLYILTDSEFIFYIVVAPVLTFCKITSIISDSDI